MSQWVKSAPSSPWKPRAWRDPTRIGTGCWNCARSPRRWCSTNVAYSEMWSPEWLGLAFWIMLRSGLHITKAMPAQDRGCAKRRDATQQVGKRVSGPDPVARRMFVTMSNLSDIRLGHRTFLDHSSEVHGCVALEPVSTVIIVCTL